MKKHCLLYPLLSLMLVGCGTTPPVSTSLSPSSSVEEPVKEATLTLKMIQKMSLGFAAESIFCTGNDTMDYSYNYVQTASKAQEFEAKLYESSKSNPTLDKVVKKMHYASYKESLFPVLAEIELGLDNQIHYYPVVDSNYSPIYWAGSGYGNAFNLLSPYSFEKGDELNEYVLKMNDDSLNNFYTSAGAQLTGYMGYELESFSMIINDEHPVSYEAVFKPIDTNYGIFKTSASGKFTQFGSDVITSLKPVEGEEDTYFQERIQSLKNNNYQLDLTLSSREVQACVENGNVLYEFYDKNHKKTGSYGYYQKTESTVQGITKIKDKIYPDGDQLNGTMDMMLPTFNISSVFFNKSESSTEDKVIYELKENISATIQSSDYGFLASDKSGTLTIEFEKESITIINTTRLAKEIFVYSKIGQMSDILSTLQPNVDTLTWSELTSNQEEEQTHLYKTISSEAVNQIPTIGGKYAMITLNASYNPKKPVFLLTFDDYTEAQEVQKNYEQKLVNSGFALLEEKGPNGGNYFTKSCQVNGETKVIAAETYLAADFFKTIQFLIYPSIIG